MFAFLCETSNISPLKIEEILTSLKFLCVWMCVITTFPSNHCYPDHAEITVVIWSHLDFRGHTHHTLFTCYLLWWLGRSLRMVFNTQCWKTVNFCYSSFGKDSSWQFSELLNPMGRAKYQTCLRKCYCILSIYKPNTCSWRMPAQLLSKQMNSKCQVSTHSPGFVQEADCCSHCFPFPAGTLLATALLIQTMTFDIWIRNLLHFNKQ